MNAWLITSHALAIVACDHPDLSAEAYDSARPSPLPIASSFELGPDSSRRLHRAVNAVLSKRALPVEIIESGCADKVAEVTLDQPVDFATEVAEPIAWSLVRQWFGLTQDELGMIVALFVAANTDADPARRAAASQMATHELSATITARRRHPTDDLLGRLVLAWDAQSAHDHWLVAFTAPMFNSLAQGFGGRLVTHAALQLSTRPDLQQELRDGGWEVARRAALEAARLDPINQVIPRRAKRTLRLAGETISAGDAVWIVIPAVCRDEDAHPAPDDFQLRRARHHLGFGYGTHICSGRELALAVAATALTEIVLRRHLELIPVPNDPPKFRVDLGRSCVRLPLILTVAAG